MPLAPTARAWLLVAGDSAGGNLAAMVCLRAREARDPPIQGQLLFYPVTAHYDPPTPSYGEFAEGQAYADRLRDAGRGLQPPLRRRHAPRLHGPDRPAPPGPGCHVRGLQVDSRTSVRPIGLSRWMGRS
ncbi:MAG TPA: alpha/beta hydrolase fold domain-containing protein [Piscinibacter sp.]|nr:alpha/beta hydrolase fold domain-containing protein [Piscinibacter sp.]